MMKVLGRIWKTMLARGPGSDRQSRGGVVGTLRLATALLIALIALTGPGGVRGPFSGGSPGAGCGHSRLRGKHVHRRGKRRFLDDGRDGERGRG